MSKPDDIPLELAFAMSRVHQPNEKLQEFLRVYGPERGVFEYEGLPCIYQRDPEKDEQQRQKDLALIEKAKGIAQENGWDWNDVVTLAQKAMGLDHLWRSEQGRRTAAMIEADRLARERGLARSEAIMAQNAPAIEEARLAHVAHLQKEREERERPEKERQRQFAEEVRRNTLAREQSVKEIAAFVSRQKPETLISVRGAKTKKARRDIVDQLMLATGYRNEALVREAIDHAIQTTIYTKDLCKPSPKNNARTS